MMKYETLFLGTKVVVGILFFCCIIGSFTQLPASSTLPHFKPSPQIGTITMHERAGDGLGISCNDLLFIAFKFALQATQTIVHECGHAAVVCAYNPEFLHGVHFFTYDSHKKPLFSLGKFHVHNDHLGGVTSHGTLPEPYHSLCLLAGGAAGCCFCYLLLMTITTYCSAGLKVSLPGALWSGFKGAFSPFDCIVNAPSMTRFQKENLLRLAFVIVFLLIEEVFYAFTPNGYNKGLATNFQDLNDDGDGEVLWSKLLKKYPTLLSIGRVLSVIGEAGCFCLAYTYWKDAQRKLI